MCEGGDRGLSVWGDCSKFMFKICYKIYGFYYNRYNENHWVVYYESIKRELKTRPIYECRCDERLKTNTEESTRLTCTGLS